MSTILCPIEPVVSYVLSETAQPTKKNIRGGLDRYGCMIITSPKKDLIKIIII